MCQRFECHAACMKQWSGPCQALADPGMEYLDVLFSWGPFGCANLLVKVTGGGVVHVVVYVPGHCGGSWWCHNHVGGAGKGSAW